MADEKKYDLVVQLLRKTQAGKLDWEESASSGQYIVTIGENSIVMLIGTDSDGLEVPYIRLQDMFGSTIDEFCYESLGTGQSYTLMTDLYNRARGRAKGIDEALDNILKQLNKPDEDDFPF